MSKFFRLLSVLVLSIASTGLYSQNRPISDTSLEPVRFPAIGLKSNLLYDVTTTFNVGAEILLSDYLTLDLSVNYNPWKYSENKQFRHILVQPELKYWVYEPFNGHFLGTNLLYTYYNIGNINLSSSFKDSRYQGNGYGLGFSYGYQWILSPRWNLEASLGVGYVYFNYSRYECQTCGKKLKDTHKNYFGPTKAALSLIYMIP